jgi:hypothetical protein
MQFAAASFPLRLFDFPLGIRGDVQVAPRPRTIEHERDHQYPSNDEPQQDSFHAISYFALTRSVPFPSTWLNSIGKLRPE